MRISTLRPLTGAVSLLAALAFLGHAHAADRYADRPETQQFINEMHERHGFDKDALTFIFRRAQYLPSVIKAISPPRDPVAVRSWQRYRGRFIDPVRIKAGIAFWERHRESIRAASDKYGVPEEIIVGIIGVETIYGRNTGSYQAVSALSTLAFDYPRRAELFRGELENLLLMAREQGRDPLDYQGSYAGALGLPQFLPSSVRNYAVDFDGDGQIDLLNSPKDAIGSVARFLSEHGWERDGPIWQPATVSGENVASLLAEGLEPRRTPRELAENGVVSGNAPDHPAALIDLVTPGAPTEYRLGYRNFYVLTRYNRSSFYASAVADLAEELAPR